MGEPLIRPKTRPQRLQYQALKKVIGGVQRSRMEKVNRITGVEDVDAIMKAIQARFVA